MPHALPPRLALVYEDAARQHAEVRSGADAIADGALAALVEDGGGPTPFNTIGFDRAEVAPGPDGGLVWVEAPAYGFGTTADATAAVSVTATGDAFVLENGFLRAELGRDGRLRSLVELRSGREALAGPGNALQVYDDHPTAHDAWDVDPFHLETGVECPPASSWRVVTETPLRVEVEFDRELTDRSRMTQRVRLDAGSRRL